MPLYKGSCGCYNREDARELGLTAAVVWNDMMDRSEHFGINPMWYDQKDAADRLGMSETTLKRAADKLVDAGRISKRKGYRPGTTVSTTWVTIYAEEVGGYDTSRKSDLTLPRKSDMTLPILKETKERDSTLGSAEMDSTDSEEESDGGEHMRPEVLYTRVKSFWKGPNELRKQKVAALEQLQEDLSDETIIEGFRLIAAHPTITLSNGEEFTYTLTNMLVREDLTKTAVNLVKAVEKSQNKKKKVISGGICY